MPVLVQGKQPKPGNPRAGWSASLGIAALASLAGAPAQFSLSSSSSGAASGPGPGLLLQRFLETDADDRGSDQRRGRSEGKRCREPDAPPHE